MSTAIFSTRFVSHQGLSGTGASIVVPVGHVYIVKQLTIYCNAAISQTTIFFQDDSSGAALFSGAVNPGTPEWFGFYGALVFSPGGGFHFQVDSASAESADVYAGGYDLTS